MEQKQLEAEEKRLAVEEKRLNIDEQRSLLQQRVVRMLFKSSMLGKQRFSVLYALCFTKVKL